MLTATAPNPLTDPLFFSFIAFCANPSTATLQTICDAAKPRIPAPPALTDAPGPWRATDAPGAFDTDFTEIRVVTSKPLRSDRLEVIGQAVGYAMKETLYGDPMVLTAVEQKLELVNGRIQEGAGESILTYTFDSTSSRRRVPRFARSFQVAKERIFDGSPVRTTDREGDGTKGTRLVEGIGAGRCTVQFFVR